MKNKLPIAVLVADLHLSLRPPAARSAEPDWLATQAGYLKQLRQIADLSERKASGQLTLPVICAGDLFDKPNPSPELINFAIKHLPAMHAVPGQHDLNYHRYEDLKKTAYWTLVEAGKVVDLKPGKPVEVNSGGTALRLHGFPWGISVYPPKDPHDLLLEVAVIHSYIWTMGTGYPGAPGGHRARNWLKCVYNFDVAVFGDNHKSFSYSPPPGSVYKTLVWNCGGFIRRRTDEKNHRPSVGLLYADGSVKRTYLDTGRDRFIDDRVEQVKSSLKGAEILDFLEELENLADKDIDFRGAIMEWLDREKVPAEVRRTVLQALEERK